MRFRQKLAVFLSIIMVFQLLLPAQAALGASRGAGEQIWGTTVDLLEEGVASPSCASPSEAYKDLKMLAGKAGTGSMAISEGKAAFSVYFDLDNEYLRDMFEEYVIPGMDQDETDLEAAAEAVGDLPVISFRTSIDGTLFKDPGIHNEHLVTSDGKEIGKYSLSKDSGRGIIILECELKRGIYGAQDVEVYKIFELDLLNSDAGNGKFPVIAPGSGGIDVSVKLVEDPDDPENVEGRYEIEKEGPESITSSRLTYTITATAAEDGGDLAGMAVQDKLPSSLELVSAEAVVESEDGDTETYGYNAASPSDADARLWRKTDRHNLMFSIPDSGRDVTTVTVTLDTQMTLDFYNKYMKGQAGDISNKAGLLRNGPDDKTPFKDSEITSRNDVPFFAKEGKPYGDLNGKRWRWTVTLNPSFTTAQGIYLIDTISDMGAHCYTGFGEEGGEEPLLHFSHKTGDTAAVDADMNIPRLELSQVKERLETAGLSSDFYKIEKLKTGPEGSVVAEAIIGGAGSSEGVYYTYEETKNGRTAVRGVLIAPLKEDYKQGRLTIQYDTKLTDISGDNSELLRDLNNDAYVVWREATYGGMGGFEGQPVGINGVDILKNVTANFRMLDKTAGDYDEDTQTMEWIFEVNRLGTEAINFEITDTFDVSKQELILFGDSDPLKLVSLNRSDGSEGAETAVGTDQRQPVWYEITTDTAGETVRTAFKLHFDRIEASQCYRFKLRTKVVDPGLLSGQGVNVGQISNTARYASEGSIPSDATAISAVGTVSNTWIIKNTIPFETADGKQYLYDYDEHTMKWRIEINPNHLPVTELVVTDLLPSETTFWRWTKAEMIPKTGPSKVLENLSGTDSVPVADPKAEFKDGGGNTLLTINLENITAGTGSPEFHFAAAGGGLGPSPDPDNEITDSFILEFTTQVNEEFRNEQLIQMQKNRELTFHNKASLSGIYREHPVSGQDTADNAPLVRGVVKNGKYHHYTDGAYSYDGESVKMSWIQWTIALNKDQADLTGMVMEDKLGGYYELDEGSLKIYQVPSDELGADGSYSLTGGGVIDVTADVKAETASASDGSLSRNLTVNSGLLRYHIPADRKNQTLVFQFNTLLVDSATAAQMTNKVTLSRENGDLVGESDEKADGAQNFGFDEYVRASTVPFVRVKKGSNNSEIIYDTSHEENGFRYPLAGAEFTVTPYKRTTAGGSARALSWDLEDSAKRVKVANADGICNFLPLKRGILYKVEETAAPDGYVLQDEAAFYVLFRNKVMQDTPDKTWSLEEFLEGSGIEPGQVMVLNTSQSYLLELIRNSPDEEVRKDIKFKKVSEQGELIPGITFTLADQAARLKDKQITVGSDGNLSYQGLDKAVYYLNEKEALQGFERIKDKTLTVTVDDTGTTITSTDPGLLKKDGDGNYQIVNRAKRSGVKLAKYTPDKTSLSGAEFAVYTDQAAARPVAFIRQMTAGGSYTLTTEPSAKYKKLPDPVALVNQKQIPGGVDGGVFTIPYVQDGKLLDGIYYLKEYAQPDYFELDSKVYGFKLDTEKITAAGALPVTVASDGKTIQFTNYSKSTIEGTKYSVFRDYSGNTVKKPLQGALFDLYDSSGRVVRNGGTDGQGVSGQDGKFYFYGVDYGVYTVKEARAPEGYKADENSFQVTVNDNRPVSQGVSAKDGRTAAVAFENHRDTGSLRINKTDENGRSLKGVIFDVYTKDQVKVATLEMKTEGGDRFYALPAANAKSDLLMNAAGEPYVQNVLQSDGGTVPSLIAGEYYVVESRPAPGYRFELDDAGQIRKHPFAVTVNGSCLTVTNDSVLTDDEENHAFTNEKADLSLVLDKKVEKPDGATTAGQGYEFLISYEDTESGGLYTDSRIQDFARVGEGEIVAEGTPEENWVQVKTGENGKVLLENVLIGSYTVKELTGGENGGQAEESPYVIPAAARYRFNIDESNRPALNGLTGNVITVENMLKRYEIRGVKQDVQTKDGLAGAKIGLFPQGTTVFDEDHLFLQTQTISGRDGIFLFEGVPYGRYVVAELEAPMGYEKDEETSYLVSAAGDPAVTITTGGKPGEGEGFVESSLLIENRRIEKEPEEPTPPETTEPERPSNPDHGGGTGGNRPGGGTGDVNSGPGVSGENPSDPSGETNPAEPNPSVPEKLPPVSNPDGSYEITVPDASNTRVEISKSDNAVIYRGRTDENGNIHLNLSPDNYNLVTLDEEGVPLSSYQFIIDDGEIPLGLPKTGDSGAGEKPYLPTALLAAGLLGVFLPGFYKHRKKQSK